MSGHSKWHNIQARKGKQDALRSNMFSKLSKVISVAARQGADPAMNFSLRLAIEKAKASGMPKDNIERAVKKGSGADGGAQMEEILYEAFGPGGTAILIKAVTDNKNRTLQDVKHVLSKNGGSLGNSGSVLWMFEQFGWVAIEKKQLSEKNLNRDDFDLSLIDAGAEDIQDVDEETVELKTKVENLKNVLDKLKEMDIEPEESGLIWEAKEKISANSETDEKLKKLFAQFEENDDVDDWYTNAE